MKDGGGDGETWQSGLNFEILFECVERPGDKSGLLEEDTLYCHFHGQSIWVGGPLLFVAVVILGYGRQSWDKVEESTKWLHQLGQGVERGGGRGAPRGWQRADGRRTS